MSILNTILGKLTGKSAPKQDWGEFPVDKMSPKMVVPIPIENLFPK
jgi:hypothetical protein